MSKSKGELSTVWLGQSMEADLSLQSGLCKIVLYSVISAHNVFYSTVTNNECHCKHSKRMAKKSKNTVLLKLLYLTSLSHYNQSSVLLAYKTYLGRYLFSGFNQIIGRVCSLCLTSVEFCADSVSCLRRFY